MNASKQFILFVVLPLAASSLGAQATRTIDEATDTVTIQVPAQSGYFVIIEVMPGYVHPVDISHGGVLDTTSSNATEFGDIKWGPFPGSQGVTVSYRLIGDERFSSQLRGVAGFPEGSFIPQIPTIGGDTAVTVSSADPYLKWANDRFDDPDSILALPYLDPDGDALPNYAERLLRLRPDTFNGNPLEINVSPHGEVRLAVEIESGSQDKVTIERLEQTDAPFDTPFILPTQARAGQFNGQEILEAVDETGQSGFYRLTVSPE